jgi:hypothetical protein
MPSTILGLIRSDCKHLCPCKAISDYQCKMYCPNPTECEAGRSRWENCVRLKRKIKKLEHKTDREGI